MNELTETFAIRIVNPETFATLGYFNIKGKPITFNSYGEAQKKIADVKYPGLYQIEKLFVVTPSVQCERSLT
jgi:hypothetical protein